MSSFQVTIRAAKGHLLLGGVKVHVSSRFATLAQANDWFHQAIDANRAAGRRWASASVDEIQKPAEVSYA